MKKQGSSNITIIIPNYNSSTVITKCLESIKNQKYKALEIIIVDNNSSDNSIEIIEAFKKKNNKMRIDILRQKVNKGLIPSYIWGIQKAKTKYVILMHSDGRLPSPIELERVVEPFEKDKDIVGAYPLILHPQSIWKYYSFWQKLQFARVVGRKDPGLSGKFDCYKKDVILKVFVQLKKRFANTDQAGGEDWDLYSLLQKEGKVVSTKACVEHLHYMGGDLSVWDYIKKRKHVAKSYGKLLKMYNLKMGPKGIFAFTFKPFLAIISFIPIVNYYIIPLIFIFSIISTKKMFLTKQTLLNPRIIILPFLNIFLIYFETYWIIKSYLYKNRS